MIIEVGKPWKCSCCKRETQPSGWFAAHYMLELTHVCPDCGQIINILDGAVDIVRPGEKT